MLISTLFIQSLIYHCLDNLWVLKTTAHPNILGNHQLRCPLVPNSFQLDRFVGIDQNYYLIIFSHGAL